jgi:hypothetical protein
MPAQACPLTPVKVLGRNGYTLRVRSYDMFTNQLIGEETYSINADPWEGIVAWDTPYNKTIMLAVLEVVDSSGNVVERWSCPFFYVPGAQELRLPSRDYDVVHMSKVAMISRVVHNVGMTFLDDMLIAVVRKPGYLALYDGTRKVFEATGKSAIVPLTFTIRRDIARAFANYIDDRDVADIVYKAPELLDVIGAVALVKQICESLKFTYFQVAPVYPSTTSDYITINVVFYTDLHSPLDWWGIVRIIAGVAAIVSGVIATIATIGLGAPVGLALILGGLSVLAGAVVIYDTAVSQNPMPVTRQAELIIQTALQQMQNYRNQLKQYLDQLVSQGKITTDEENKILSYVDSIIGIAQTAFQELNKLVESAYEEGKKSMYPWVVVAGVAGVLIGMILQQRAM